MFHNAGLLFDVAKEACNRTRSTPSPREPGATDALVAIVFSAAALEAFINETTEVAKRDPQPAAIRVFADLADELERSRESVRLKFLLARSALVGSAYDKGAQPYQDFELLIALRNALVHLKPVEEYEFSPGNGCWSVKMPSVIRGLESKQLLADIVEPDARSPWTIWISTQAVARWACNAAANMVQSFLQVLPETKFKERLQFIYATHFQPVA